MKSVRSAKSSKAKLGPQARRLAAAIGEMKAMQAGTAAPSRTFEVVADGKGGFLRRQLGLPSDASSARLKLKLSQQGFADLLGVSKRTLESWEQGRREPTRAAKVLICVAAEHPRAVLDAAKKVA